MSEELSAVLTLRASSREPVDKGVQMLQAIGSGANLLQALAPMPAEWVQPDGSFRDEAVEWAYEHWGCKGLRLGDEMWWEETEPGDESNEWWACWDVTTVNGVPQPILKALSERLPDLQIGYYLQRIEEDYEVIYVNGEIDYEDGEVE